MIPMEAAPYTSLSGDVAFLAALITRLGQAVVGEGHSRTIPNQVSSPSRNDVGSTDNV